MTTNFICSDCMTGYLNCCQNIGCVYTYWINEIILLGHFLEIMDQQVIKVIFFIMALCIKLISNYIYCTGDESPILCTHILAGIKADLLQQTHHIHKKHTQGMYVLYCIQQERCKEGGTCNYSNPLLPIQPLLHFLFQFTIIHLMYTVIKCQSQTTQ